MRKLAATLFVILFVAVSNVFPYVIPGGATHTFARTLYRGRVIIEIRGNGATNLDLYVYQGNMLIGRSEGGGDWERIDIQTAGGPVTIAVVNRGSYANNYQANF